MGLGDWLQERLFERRIVLVTGLLQDDTAARAAAALVALDARSAEAIELQIDSADGTLEAALARRGA